MLVMLRTDWPGDTFRRGGIVFERGIPIDVDDETLKLLANDLGKSLVLVKHANAKADHDATAEAAADLDAFLMKRTAEGGPPTDEQSPAEPTSEAVTTTTETVALVEPPPARRRR